MGIYIKGMKIPNGCTECAFGKGFQYCEAMPPHFCGEVEWEMDDMKPEWCPLVEMPTHGKCTETHGVCLDAISRQDTIDAIEHVTWYHQNRNGQMVSGANSDEHQAWYKAEDIYKAIKAVPSANRSGHWVMNPSEVAGDGYYICSNCNNDVYDATDFCPNCGSYNGGESNG